MKKFYTYAHNFFIILKVFCPIISFLYALLWIISFLNIPFFKIISIPFAPFAQFVNIIFPINIDYEGRLIDMSYIVCSGLFILFHYVFGFFAQSVIDLYNFEESQIAEKNKREVKKINKNLEKEFKEEIRKYCNFTFLFNLILKPGYDLSISRKGEFDILKKEFYSHITKVINTKYKNSKYLASDKLFLVCENFNCFDDFMINFIEEIKTFNATMLEKDISMEFSLSLNAVKSVTNIFNAMEFLEKIDSFNYKNKIITTSAFKLRYEQAKNHKFKIMPLGISRFFNGPDDYIDFELYNLKLKN